MPAAIVVALAASLQCMLGIADCVNSQGSAIPSKQVITILDRCNDFTRGDIGRTALRLSSAAIHDQARGRITPLVRAWHALGDLYDSPLKFDRSARAGDSKYWEIKKSCQQLERDFNEWAK